MAVVEKISYKLEKFEGPLDLLLHLISKNKLSIYDIPVSELLVQYLEHIEAMRQADMEVASEFLAMATRLVYIKTAMLMPRREEAEELKKELEGELIEYQLCREVAERLAQRANFDRFSREEMKLEFEGGYRVQHEPAVIYRAYLAALGRGKKHLPPPVTSFEAIVAKKVVSVQSRVICILKQLYRRGSIGYEELFSRSSSRSELVATFIALLELVKNKRVGIDEDRVNLINGGGRNWRSKNSEQQ